MGKWTVCALVVLVVILTSSLAFAQEEQLYEPAPTAQAGPAEQLGPDIWPQQATAPTNEVPAGADQLPLGDSLEDTQKAANQVLSGNGNVSFNSVTAQEGRFRHLWVNGKEIIVDRRGRIVAMGTHRRPLTKAEQGKRDKRAYEAFLRKVKSGGFLTARNLSGLETRVSNTERGLTNLDSRVTQLERSSRGHGWLAWWAIGIAALALILGLWRMPIWRTIYAPPPYTPTP